MRLVKTFLFIIKKNITEENLFEIMYELYKLTENGQFSAAHIANIATVFEKVSSLSSITYHSALLLFRILNNILNSPESEFQRDMKAANRYAIYYNNIRRGSSEYKVFDFYL
jgi:hypothetical protein